MAQINLLGDKQLEFGGLAAEENGAELDEKLHPLVEVLLLCSGWLGIKEGDGFGFFDERVGVREEMQEGF